MLESTWSAQTNSLPAPSPVLSNPPASLILFSELHSLRSTPRTLLFSLCFPFSFSRSLFPATHISFFSSFLFVSSSTSHPRLSCYPSHLPPESSPLESRQRDSKKIIIIPKSLSLLGWGGSTVCLCLVWKRRKGIIDQGLCFQYQLTWLDNISTY